MRRLTVGLLLVACAAAATFVLHGRTLEYGFDYDDYHFIHPYTRAEVAAAVRGPWDASGIELPYFRPLTIAFFAARFEMLGVNSAAHHALSLILFAVVAAVTGWLAYRGTGRALAGFLASVLVVAHPAMPYSLVAWVTNQMHLLEALTVLAALAWWDAVRHSRVVLWIPLLLLAVVAFLLKEDGIMLLPCIASVHVIRRHIAEPDLPPLRWTFVISSALLIAALLVWRADALHGLTSRRTPSLEAGARNYAEGLYRVFFLAPADRPWQRAASWFVVALPVAAIAFWRRATDRCRAALLSGVTIAVLFDLPFIFVTKAEQLHMVALGAALVLCASAIAIGEALRSHALRGVFFLVTCGGIAALTAVTMNVTRDFEPFGPIVLAHDAIVREWAAVPPELREYLEQKRARGAAQQLPSNPAEAVERITFGAHGRESSGGISFRWMAGPRIEILVARDAQTVTIPIRHAIEIVRRPAQVTVAADGRLLDRIDLTTSEWRVSTIALPPGGVSRWSGMHRVTIATGDVWNPATVIAGSTDDRTLGLQIGEIRVTRAGTRR